MKILSRFVIKRWRLCKLVLNDDEMAMSLRELKLINLAWAQAEIVKTTHSYVHICVCYLK